MHRQIDLNADIGEGCEHDQMLLSLVSSVNISCGAHAGDETSISAAIDGAIRERVAIGAHPSWPDRKHFGRLPMQMTANELAHTLLQQLSDLTDRVNAAGAQLQHVKPHGALYNQAAIDAVLANSLVSIIKDFDSRLTVVGLAGSRLQSAAERAGVDFSAEAFADRAYAADGTLVPRSDPRSVLSNPQQAITQCLDLITRGFIRSVDGHRLPMHADTVCLHGDTPDALKFALALRDAFEEHGVQIRRNEPGRST